MDRSASVFIVLLAVFCVVLGGGGSEPEQVRTVAELMNVFAGQTEPVTTDIELLADLDFSAEGLGYPLGAASGACVPYKGTLDGHGHTIRGITMDNAGKIVYNHAALLCDLSDEPGDRLVVPLHGQLGRRGRRARQLKSGVAECDEPRHRHRE